MSNVATKRKFPCLSYLFVTILGCGSGQTAHRFVPPVLPPMDPEVQSVPVAIAAAANAGPEPMPRLPDAAPPITTEPGHAQGPCPAPSNEAQRILARAIELEKTTSDPGPHRAIAEAIRLRLDSLFQHGCHRQLDDEHLLAAVAEIAPDPKEFTERLELRNRGELGIVAYYGTYASGWIGQYRWHEGMIRTSILITGERGGMDKQFLALSFKLATLPGYPDPVLVLANTHPWMSSCWRGMRIRILAPTGDPLKPKALLDKLLDGRWCEGITSEVKGATVTFSYESWGGPWSIAAVQRPYTLTYEFKAGAFVEHFGFAPRFEDLPEDWLMRDWSLSQEATVEAHRGLLQSIHETLHRTLTDHDRPDDSEYSKELFAVSNTERRIAMYCAQRETGQRCKEWPKQVDFFIARRDGIWYVKDVVPRK